MRQPLRDTPGDHGRREGKLFYGCRCEKYDVERKAAKDENQLPRLFALGAEMLAQRLGPVAKAPIQRAVRVSKIGVPWVLFFHEQFPFWRTFFEELGFTSRAVRQEQQADDKAGAGGRGRRVVLPDKDGARAYTGLDRKGVERIFLPSLINLAQEETRWRAAWHARTCRPCRTSRPLPYRAQAHAPSIDFGQGMAEIARELKAR